MRDTNRLIEVVYAALGAIVVSGTVLWFGRAIFIAWQKGVLIP